MRQLKNAHRRLFVGIGAALAGAGLFASGVLVAAAMDDDDSNPSGSGDSSANTTDIGAPAVSRGAAAPGSPPAATNPALLQTGGSGRGEDGDDARSSLSPDRGYGCLVPIPGVLSDGKIDPSAAGFVATYLGAGFELTSVSVRGEADCSTGTPSGEARVAVDTLWKHTETGLSVYVTQRQAPEASASVLEELNARFSRDGYDFFVGVDGYSVQPVAGVDDGTEEARDLLPGADPRAGEVLRLALGQLNAPSEACFYTVRAGSFEDLAAMGIGDPRSGIPSGYSLQDVYVRTWNEPSADCGTPAEGLQTSFNATWVSDADGQRGAIYVSASSIFEGELPYPGNANEYYANWSNGKFHLSVGAKIDPPIGGDVISAVARAMDPGFPDACIAREGELSDEALLAQGFGIPSAPDGYTVTSRSHRASTLTGDCTSEMQQNYQPSSNGNWVLTGPDGAIINVSAWKSSPVPAAEKESGFISDYGLSWFADNGIHYDVNGWNERGGEAPSRDTLIAVARSIDPGLELDSLQEPPDGGGSAGSPPVKPMLAEDSARQ